MRQRLHNSHQFRIDSACNRRAAEESSEISAIVSDESKFRDAAFRICWDIFQQPSDFNTIEWDFRVDDVMGWILVICIRFDYI